MQIELFCALTTTAARQAFVGRVIAKWPGGELYLAAKMPLWQCGRTLEEAKHTFEATPAAGRGYIDFYLLPPCTPPGADRAGNNRGLAVGTEKAGPYPQLQLLLPRQRSGP